MGNIGTPLSTMLIVAGIYTVVWFLVWHLIEWRLKILFEHNYQKIPLSILSSLKKVEIKTLWGIRVLMLLTLSGSIMILYFLIF